MGIGITRKGANPAEAGKPVLIPGSMGSPLPLQYY